jgi:hypothetical protein
MSPTGNNAGTSTNAKMRKRTKTGCLTCRKRRIKCGEERPTCGNCIKSKRQCEGYNQRVVFKTPIENWPNHPGNVSTIQYHSSMLPGTRNESYQPPRPVAQAQESSTPSTQPRHLGNFDFANVDLNSNAGHAVPQHVAVGGPHGYAQDTSYQQPLPSPHHHQPLVSPHHHAHVSGSASTRVQTIKPLHRTDKFTRPISKCQRPTKATMTIESPSPILSLNSPSTGIKSVVSQTISALITLIQVFRRVVISTHNIRTHGPSHSNITAICRLHHNTFKPVQRG